MNSIVKEKLPQIAELCKKYRVARFYLFGSAALRKSSQTPHQKPPNDEHIFCF